MATRARAILTCVTVQPDLAVGAIHIADQTRLVVQAAAQQAVNDLLQLLDLFVLLVVLQDLV